MKKLLFICFLFFSPFIVNAKEVDLKTIQIIDTKQDKADEVKIYYKGNTKNPEVGEIIEKRSENSQTFQIKEDLFVKKVYNADVFYNEFGSWYEIDVATTTLDNFNKLSYGKWSDFLRILPVKADTSQIFADTGDGYATWNTLDSTSWTNAVNGAPGTGAVSNNATVVINAYIDATQTQIHRAFLSFDVDLEAGAVVDTASIGVYVIAKSDGDNDAQGYTVVVEGNQASITELVAGDYDNVGTTALSDMKDTTSVSTSAYLYYVLNATATSSIENGTMKYAIREGHDLEDSAPSSGTDNGISFSGTEETGTTQDPYLSIVYHLEEEEQGATSTPIATGTVMILETGFINQVVKYTENYDASGTLLNVEYSIYHIPFITFSVVIFSAWCFWFFAYQMLKRGWNKKNKIMED